MTAGTDHARLPTDAEFTALFQAHYKAVVARLKRAGCESREAEDIAQEAMFVVWTKWSAYPTEPHRKELANITADRKLRDRREVAKRCSLVAVVPDDALVDSAPEPDEAVVNSELRKRLGAALQTLSPAIRDPFVDAVLWNVRPQELRRRYGATDAALRKRRQRAKADLMVVLETCGAPVVFVLRSWCGLRQRVHHALAHAGGLAHAAGVVATALAVVVGPFNGPLGPVPHARAEVPVPQIVKTDVREAPRPVAVSDNRADRLMPSAPAAPERRAVTTIEQLPERPIRPPRGPKPRLPEPPVCVGGVGAACPDDKPGDRITVHLPGRDVWFVQDVAPACPYVPDQPVVECHTQGNAEYHASPPPLTGGD